MEMTMNVLSGNRMKHNMITAAIGTTWTTEFERIYLMTAARVRGELVVARQHANMTRPVFVRGR